jgi:hypothetical protein
MRYQVSTSLTLPDVLERAIAYFGPGGQGLILTSQSDQSLMFQGGGGHVAITVQPGAETILELETREWDYAVQQFMAQISGRRRWWHRLLRRKRQPPSSPPTFTILNNDPYPRRPEITPRRRQALKSLAERGSWSKCLYRVKAYRQTLARLARKGFAS